MIELNLIPKELHKNRKQPGSGLNIKFPKIAPVPLIVGIIVVIIFSQVVLSLLAAMQQKKLAAVNARLSTIMPKYKIAVALKKEFDILAGKVAVIDSLRSGSLVWAKKLYDLNNSLIDGMWLNSLSLSVEHVKPDNQPRAPVRGGHMQQAPIQPKDKETLVLQGTAVSSGSEDATAIVGRFIDSLKNNESFFKDFEDIKLSSVQRENLGAAEVMNFTIVCYFQSGRSYFEKL